RWSPVGSTTCFGKLAGRKVDEAWRAPVRNQSRSLMTGPPNVALKSWMCSTVLPVWTPRRRISSLTASAIQDPWVPPAYPDALKVLPPSRMTIDWRKPPAALSAGIALVVMLTSAPTASLKYGVALLTNRLTRKPSTTYEF